MTAYPITKRAVDLAISLPLLLAAAPLCLLLMLAIRWESRGNPLFIQVRVGRARKRFRMFKLRTMAQGTPDVASHEAPPASVTRLGAVLRKLKLDELPQLVNVIAGSMSLVGPRPCLPSQQELIDARERRGLFALRPGVTGPAQVVGVDMSEPERLATVEAEYFARASLAGDLDLIVRTARGGGRGDAAPNPGSKLS
jgi:O-antigen biosynthesis protein WbqP